LTPKRFRPACAAVVARSLLRCLGVRIGAVPRKPGRPALLVLNHVSWLDILIVLACSEATILAKAEVRQWPVIGRLAASLGTLFVDRSRPRQLPTTVGEVAMALRAGRSVAIFAEGTTTCGRTVFPFRPAMFQAAIDAGAPVIPLTLSIRPAGLAGFLGDESLWESIRRIVIAPRLDVTLLPGAALYPLPHADRRVLARVAHTAVAGRLPLRRNEIRPTACRPTQPPAVAGASAVLGAAVVSAVLGAAVVSAVPGTAVVSAVPGTAVVSGAVVVPAVPDGVVSVG
jgi:1-acyl-sn-glycerol-3-phosphate acyltransferase